MPTGVYPRTEYHRKINLGRKHTEEWKKRMSDFFKKHPNKPWLGKKRPPITEEWRRKLSERQIGDKNHAWMGGISKKGYPLEWTREFVQSIRKRDKFKCKVCKKTSKHLDVHHIDYDKNNCNPNNLITLCHGCHSKTNFNRKNWIRYFND